MPQFQLLPQIPRFTQELGQRLGQSTGQSLIQGLQSQLENFNNQKKMNYLQQQFQAQGYSPELAKLAAVASTGGQTEILKKVLEERERGPLDHSLTEETFTEEIERNPREGAPKPVGLTKKENVQREREFEKRAFERNKKYLDRVSSIAEELPKERTALAQMEGALQSGDFNSWRNAFAEIIGQDVLKSASAQTVNSAAKQFLMSSLAGLTGRPNQFIEKQITKALISPVYRDAANELIFEGLKGLADLKELEVDEALSLEEKYISQGKEIPRNFQKLVRDKLKKESAKFESDYEKKVREMLKPKEKEKIMIAPNGKKYKVPKDQLKKAQEAGYKLAK